jgi:Flp pilus assembly protein TadB
MHPIFILFVVLAFALCVNVVTLWVRRSFHLSLGKKEFRSLAAFQSAKKESLLVWVGYLVVVAFICTGFEFWLGSSFFGLPFLFAGPLFQKKILSILKKRRQRKMEGSALSFFHSLHGLIQMGVSLPAALFQLTSSSGEANPVEFRTLFRSVLSRFEKGMPLVDCLDRFRVRGDWEQVGVLLVLLEIAYRNGLPLSPLLSRVLPVMEVEEQNLLRLRELTMTVVCQALIALLIPWFLEGALFFFQPESVIRFFSYEWSLPIVMSVFGMESIGAWLIWRQAAFY